LIVDDGSTDDTCDIVRMRALDHANQAAAPGERRPSAARNRAMHAPRPVVRVPGQRRHLGSRASSRRS
jgi:glycosyltransferase involved in cell wall biosynthesis